MNLWTTKEQAKRVVKGASGCWNRAIAHDAVFVAARNSRTTCRPAKTARTANEDLC